MVDWIANWLLKFGSAITQLFVHKDAVNFGVVAGVISIVVLASVVGVIALWPRRE